MTGFWGGLLMGLFIGAMIGTLGMAVLTMSRAQDEELYGEKHDPREDEHG